MSARHSTNFDDWVRLDLRYIDNWSFWLDLKICWRTARMLLFGSEIDGRAHQEANLETDRPNVQKP